jgi:outer membrane immunogenic protein
LLPFPITKTFNNSAGTAGGQVGCNWQRSQWVFGVEGDANWSGLRTNDFNAYPDIPPLPGGVGFVARNQTVTQDINWFATFRGRVGVAFGSSLFYGTGGLAVGNVRSVGNVNIFAGTTNFDGSYDATRFGWTVGAGWEQMLGANWSVKGEYLYVDLGKFSYNVILPPAGLAGYWRNDVETQFHVFRVGLNYRFGGPVVAKY